MNCKHCGEPIEETKEPKGYPLVGADGKEQKVVDTFLIGSRATRVFRTGKVERTEDIPVICIMER